MATYTSKDRTAQQATFEKLRLEYIAADKSAKLAAVHVRARDIIQAGALARVWAQAHFGGSSPTGKYRTQDATQPGDPRRGGSPYAKYYAFPAGFTSWNPSPLIANETEINSSVDMTLAARMDHYVRGWCYFTMKADQAGGVKEPWKLRPYVYVDENNKQVTVNQTPAWYALKIAAINASNLEKAGRQVAAQNFVDKVGQQTPAWYDAALVYVSRVTAFVPRVAVSTSARRMTDAVKAATTGLTDKASAVTKAGAANQPITSGGATAGQQQGKIPQDEQGKSNLLLVLGIAAAAGAVILASGEEK